MKQRLKTAIKEVRQALLNKLRRGSKRSVWIPAVILLAGGALVLVSSAYNKRPASITAQAGPPMRGRLHARLSLQPEADRFRRRLGKRFIAAGREVSVMTGLLSINGAQQPVRIARIQEDSGERLEIGPGNGPASLNWNAVEGARSQGRAPSGAERSLIERIALDSPEQFVLAQTRGASYFTIAHAVRPAEAGDSPDYDGPLWDLVRVAEPKSAAIKPLASWRVYYINTATGLIDKIVSEEQGETMTAELSGWSNLAGEMLPTTIKWSRAGLLVMELSLSNAAHGPRQ